MYRDDRKDRMWDREMERTPMRYNSNACKNCGYKNRPSMSADVCSTCIYKQYSKTINSNK